MVISKAKKHGAIFSVGVMLVLLAGLAGADDKKKDKEHGSAQPSHQKHQTSNSSPSRRQSNNNNNASGQVNTNRNVRSDNGNRDRKDSTVNRNVGNNSYQPKTQTYQPRETSKVNDDRGNKNAGFKNDGNSVQPGRNDSGAKFNKAQIYEADRGKNKNFGKPDKFNDRNGDRDRGRDRGRNDFRADQQHRVEAPRTVRQFGDRRVAYDHGGRVREIHGRNMEIRRSLRGDRRFVSESHGRRVVSVGYRQGYTERHYYSRRGNVYVQRTYVVGGVRYARAYRTYYWHGAVFYHYAPVYYYHPAFYAWAFNPWPRPIYFRWGWASDPWYPAYGYYFAPDPYYPTASLWLTDYLLAENLRLAYENRQYAAAQQQQHYDQGPQDFQPQPQDQQGPDPQSGNTVQLSPEVKQMIADEVQRQLAEQQAAAGNAQSQAAPPADSGGEETPAALDPNHRVFVVAESLDVVGDDGQECTLTAGDVILRTSNTPDGSKVAINVITSKRGDCASNTNAAVEVSDLQEMQNRFREQLDSGLKAMATDQGKNGLPAAPDTGTINGEAPAPTPDADAENELRDQQKAADKEEGAVQSVARNPGD